MVTLQNKKLFLMIFFLFPRTPEVLSIPVGNSHIKTDGTLELNK